MFALNVFCVIFLNFQTYMIHKFSVETIEKKRTFTEDLKFSFNLLFTTYMNECTISKSILNAEKK